MKIFGERLGISGDARKPRSGWTGAGKLALLGLVAIVLVMLPARASAVQLDNPFELDGNVAVNHIGSGLPDDWTRIFDPGTYGANSAFSSTFIGADKEAPGNDTTSFTGSNKDTDSIASWTWGVGNQQAKDEITDAYGAAYIVPSGPDTGHTVVYFGADRYAVNGDSNVGFWFNQDPAFGLNPNGHFNGTHMNGDLLVLSNFVNGGGTPVITVYQYENGNLNILSSGVPCTAD
ncbi:MAG: hypothetical protein M3P18_08405, partial [Actinomycetota bacterium]|nr:hypothetical protein [Actinomycetota bacterium]